MATMQLEGVIQRLRQALLMGEYAADVKLSEVPIAQSMGVSRTLVRLALGEMEREGLVHRAPRRGYRARSFTLDEVADAIEVRGALEGMAARLCAERGLDRADLSELQEIAFAMDPMIDRVAAEATARTQWVGLNAQFHDRMVALCDNASIATTVAQLSRMPLVAAQAIVFAPQDPRAMTTRLARAHAEHHDVVDAIRFRQGMRAETIMREHARRSAANKRHGLDLHLAQTTEMQLPGLTLVRAG